MKLRKGADNGSVPFFKNTFPPMRFEQTTFPSPTNVVTLIQAKSHLRVEHSDDDTLIGSLIAAAYGMVEAYTGRFLQPTLGTFYFDDFHEFMNLHGGPNMTIVADDGHGNNHGVTYTNTSNVETVVQAKDHEFDGVSYPARLRMLNEPSDIKDTVNAVKIFVEAGHTNQTDRPDALVAAMLLIIGHLYENRQDVGQHKTHATPLASRYLMQPYRLKSFA